LKNILKLLITLLFLSTLNATQINEKIQKELIDSAKSVNKYLPNKINDFLEASHNEVEGMKYISHYYTYITNGKNIEVANNEIKKFQNKIIVSTCSDKYRRELMSKYQVSFEFDFMDEFGRLNGFILDEGQCKQLGL
jgi:ribosomal protein S25